MKLASVFACRRVNKMRMLVSLVDIYHTFDNSEAMGPRMNGAC